MNTNSIILNNRAHSGLLTRIKQHLGFSTWFGRGPVKDFVHEQCAKPVPSAVTTQIGEVRAWLDEDLQKKLMKLVFKEVGPSCGPSAIDWMQGLTWACLPSAPT